MDILTNDLIPFQPKRALETLTQYKDQNYSCRISEDHQVTNPRCRVRRVAKLYALRNGNKVLIGTNIKEF